MGSHREPHYQTGDAPQPHLSSEQNLFLQVIAVAVNDYRGRNPTAKSARGPQSSAMRQDAADWLFSPLHEEDFTAVCEFAGVDPEFVRRTARIDRRLAWSRS